MSAPPRIASATKSAQNRSPAWAFAGMLLLLAGARVSLAWPIPLPFCLLKRITGIPCPFCGTTRCLQACSRLDLAAALHSNPLALVVSVGIAAWFIAWAVDRLWNLRWLGALRRALQVRALKFGLIGALFLNWVYLWLALR
jgi:hypothetical protein